MNRSSNFQRKIIYIVVLLAMVFPLYRLGQPSSGGSGDGGGELAQLRHKYNIAESDLGEISPASETMKLATLGLRGVAATLLWNRAHDYKNLHEWDRLKATLNNIALLQPHCEKVWEHQAHNLAYNVSTEFDDYRQRYEMVREGTEFLTRGVRQNREAPRLIWYTGWFYGQKMGMSDEKRQFRRLFADDTVLHDSLIEENIPVDSPEALGPQGKPDNWLVGRLWCQTGYSLIESGVRIRNQTPLNFYETGPKWRFKHAEAIESEGVLDERAENAWRLAAVDWLDFGNRSIPTTSPFTIKLASLDDLNERRQETLVEFRKLTGDAYNDAIASAIQGYPEETQAALRKLPSERTPEERKLADAIDLNVVPQNLDDVAKASSPENRLQAIQLASRMRDLIARYQKTNGYRNQINYSYWETVSAAEQEERTVRARRLVYEAEKANAEALIDKAIDLYEQSFEIWAEVFDDYPLMMTDDSALDLFDSIRRYMIATDSERLPDDFPLKEFVDATDEYGKVNTLVYLKAREETKAKKEARKKELEEEEKARRDEAEQMEDKAEAEVETTELETTELETSESSASEAAKEADQDAEVKAEDKQESEPQQDATKEPSESKPDSGNEGEPQDEPGTEDKPAGEEKSDPPPESEPSPEPKPEPKPDTEPAPETEPSPDPEPQPEADPEESSEV